MNVNDCVRFRLTDEGMRVYRSAVNPPILKTNEYGVFEGHLWEVMQIFGHRLFNGCKQIFVNNQLEVAPWSPDVGSVTSENMRKADEAVARVKAMPPTPTLAEKQATEICRNCRWWIPVPKGMLVAVGSLPQPVKIKGKVLGQCSLEPVAIAKVEDNFCSHFEQRAEVEKGKESPPLSESAFNPLCESEKQALGRIQKHAQERDVAVGVAVVSFAADELDKFKKLREAVIGRPWSKSGNPGERIVDAQWLGLIDELAHIK